MALPMVHLLAAYKWAADQKDLLECPEYYMGSIAPDAVHIRDGSDKSRKDDVHLNNWRRPNEEAVARFWRDACDPFAIGYGIHVLLDGHWAAGFRRDFPQILKSDGKPVPELYYHDMRAVDRELFETAEETPFLMDMLRRAGAPEELIIPPSERLTRHEFLLWRDATMDFYYKKDSLNGLSAQDAGKPRFITTAYTKEFIDRCGEVFTRVRGMECP